MKQGQLIIQWSLVILIAGLFTSCADRSLDSSSNRPPNTFTDIPSRDPDPDPNYSVAECNGFANATSNLAGRIRSYYTFQNNLVPEITKMRLTQMPVDFDTNDQRYIQIFRWQAPENGAPFLDSEPLFMTFENRSTKQLFGGNFTRLSYRRVIDNAAQGQSFVEFFQENNLLIAGTDLEWDALKVVVYEGDTEVGQNDVLIPEFYADPSAYGDTHPNVLNEIHPNFSRIGQGFTDSQFKAQTDAFCF